ncbi:MAG: bifunctional phosphopantothenoylcysteine decarboxylase/phosphopantothenate--cysteine ligase CoaBC [bacterium]
MRVLIGVTGSIAAYKAAEVVSALKKSGAEITVVMTEHATELIGPATFRALSGNEVRVGLFERWPGKPIHIDLATGHDVVAIIPATANIIGKIACGICDDLLSTVALSTRSPILIAPAMNEAMYGNAVVRENIATLKERGITFIEPETGWLACGTEGIGRLASLDTILAAINTAASGAEEKGAASVAGSVSATAGMGASKDLAGRKVIITGGATLEPIDDVRFISNRSSGKMAAALAGVAARRGARTVLVSGITYVPPPPGVETVTVETGDEMKQAIQDEWEDADCIVMAAAVCDFKPGKVAKGKLRRQEGLKLELVSTDDILGDLSRKKNRQMIVGFALETEDELARGKRKLDEKDLDLVIANNPLREGTGFGSDFNAGYLIYRDGRVEDVPLMSKLDLSEKVFDAVASYLAALP